MTLRGIDVSSHDGWDGSGFARAHTESCYQQSDFVVVKVSQGMDYVNPHWKEVAERVLADGKGLGLYHYAGHDAKTGTGAEEAARFASLVRDYRGKASLCLDWERYQNAAWGSKTWAADFHRVCPVEWLYTGSEGASQCIPLMGKVALWLAWYPKAQTDSWTPASRVPEVDGWGTPKMWQFTSLGNTDRNVCYVDWRNPMSKKDRLCERMVYWCTQADLGYDQGNRWDIRVGGECDCSSLVYWCLWEAGYLDRPDNYRGKTLYTGTLKRDLVAAGWEAVKPDGNPKKGDVVLSEAHHVAVCIDGSKRLAMASIDERGKASGGRSGDQTDAETKVRSYYSYPWDWYLRPPAEPTTRAVSVQLYTPNNTDAQKWKVKWDGGWCTLVNVASGLALDVKGGSSKDGTPVRAYTPNGTDAQRWKLAQLPLGNRPDTANPCVLVSKLDSSMVLDCKDGGTKDGTGVQLHANNATGAQQWQVLDQGDGVWVLVNVKSAKALDVKGGGR